MNDFIMTVIKVAAAVLPIVILCLLLNKTNLPKEQRHKQFPMPIIAVVCSLTTMFFINDINNGLLTLINSIPVWLDSLAGIAPDFLSSICTAVSDWVSGIISSLNLEFWIFFISNYVIFIAYIIIKKIILAILKRIFNKHKVLLNWVSDHFYTYYPDKNIWCIRVEYSDARTFLKILYFSSTVLFILLMMSSRWFYFNGMLNSVFYPAFGIFIVSEMFFYLDSLTVSEYNKSISGENDNSIKIVNYSLLRRYLRNLFGDKMMAENTNVNISQANDMTNDEVIDRLLNDEDPKVAAFGTFFLKLNKSGFQPDHNMISSALDMLNGKSILFNNPFYKDLIPYAFYPLNRALLQHQKVLVILGRHSIEDDVVEWIHDGIESVTNIPFLWRTGILSKSNGELEIGVLTRSDVTNIEVHKHNKDFFEQVGFVVILEPSKLITTAQVGLELIVKTCGKRGKKNIVYCLSDKNCDGLVDAMSHILMTSITEVSATNKHNGTLSYACWEADKDYIHHRLVPNISRYLGMGTELSFAALKNQVSNTVWYGGDKFPVTDMNWIARQYYYDLMKYAALPTGQQAMNDYFKTTSNFWSAGTSKNNYFTVEDESNNMFEILRDFSTRSTEQGFVNVISTDYLLKDYMAGNNTIFEADSKAIPYIVADFARTNRNVVLGLLLFMSEGGVDEETVKKELALVGLPILDVKKQLWYEIYTTLSPVTAEKDFPDNYEEAVEFVFCRNLSVSDGRNEYTSAVIQTEEKYNFELGEMQTQYVIFDENFIKSFVSSLKSASYISEDEKGEKYYLGSELSDHIYQKLLPGQYFTYGGKYYEMQYVTYYRQVLVRRAADHIDGRPTYRQIRAYNLLSLKESENIGSVKDIGGIKVTHMCADFTVSTDGYYRLDRYNDFSSAKKVLFGGEKSRIPDRTYANKRILRIDLPGGEALTDNIRYTVTLLINEVFKTLFAENAPYIVALTDDSFIADKDELKPLTYSLITADEKADKNSIYIIEDSNLDMGLLIAVERNLKRILLIIEDYLSWNKREIALSLIPPKKDEPIKLDPSQVDFEEPGNKKRGGFFKRVFKKIGAFFKKIGNFFKKLFKRKPKKEKPIPEDSDTDGSGDTQGNPESQDTQDAQDTQDTQDGADTSAEHTQAEEDKAKELDGDNTPGGEDSAEKTDASDDETAVEETPVPEGPLQAANAHNDRNGLSEPSGSEGSRLNFSRIPYHKRYYLLFGGDTEPDSIDSNGTFAYLKSLKLGSNPLKEARRGRRIAEYVAATFQPNKKNARYCDFCGNEIYGVEYETLADGRDRCMNCSRTAIKTEAEFVKIFEDVKRNMESFFGIKINAGIRVQMVNAAKLHKLLGKTFIPTSDYDGRVLGVAINKGGSFTLMIENGSPRMMSMLTMAHELTHIWQYLNWNPKHIKKKYGRALELQIYEGMAKWVEIQYAYLINEPAVAKREEIITAARNDEYGFGYIRYKANYPISGGTVITHDTPFMNTETPLDPMYCGSDVSILLQEDNSGRYDDDLDDNNYEGFVDDDYNDESDDIVPQINDGIRERNPDAVPLYAYNRLNDEEKAVYDRVCDAAAAFEETVADLPDWLTSEGIEKIRNFIIADHPELFWFEGDCTYFSDTATGKITKIQIRYPMTKEEAERRKAQIERSVTAFESGIDSGMSDYEVAKTIYDNIIKAVDYDSVGLDISEKNADKTQPDDLRSIYGVIVNRKAVCGGYAKATQYLMNKYGIECTTVLGDTKQGYHAWNLIKLEGDYYYIDTTWGDRSNTDPEKNYSSDISYDYFCITTEELLEDHTPDSTLEWPLCTATKCNYFCRSGKLLHTYTFEKVRNIVKKCVGRGELKVSIKCENKDDYNRMTNELIDKNRFYEIIQYINLTESHRLASEFSYTTRKEKPIITFNLKRL